MRPDHTAWFQFNQRRRAKIFADLRDGPKRLVMANACGGAKCPTTELTGDACGGAKCPTTELTGDACGGAKCATHCFGRRRGFSLLEVIAAAALVGLMAIAASRPMRLGALGSLQAKTIARRLSLDLLRTRRLAITSGTPHQLMFGRDQGKIVGYEVRRAGKHTCLEVVLPPHVIVSASSDVEFVATGEAAKAVKVRVRGASSSGKHWKIDVARATGAVFVDSR